MVFTTVMHVQKTLSTMASKAPKKSETVLLDGPAGKLECLLEVPADCHGRQVALICHPHPLYQGTMHNKVVHTLARSMHDLGIPTLRFNFRGVGGSEGEHADGIGETDDTVFLSAWLLEQFQDAELWLAGFSFGGMVAVLAANRCNAQQLITIAPAVGMIGEGAELNPQAHWLLVHGADDELIDAATVLSWVETLSTKPEVVILPDATHFFHGQLVTLRKLLVEKLSNATRFSL